MSLDSCIISNETDLHYHTLTRIVKSQNAENVVSCAMPGKVFCSPSPIISRSFICAYSYASKMKPYAKVVHLLMLSASRIAVSCCSFLSAKDKLYFSLSFFFLGGGGDI